MKRKLKTIKQILDENPDYYFDDYGCLYNVGYIGISREMLCFLGKELPDEDYCGWEWDDSWFEKQPEPKKLYAFKGVGTNRVEWFTTSTLPKYFDECGWERYPDADREIGGKEDENS